LTEFVDPPIIVAHSLGALLAQRLLGRVSMRAIIMLAPVPPEGLSILGPWLFLSRPSLWLDVLNAALGAVRYGQPAGAREGLISQRLSAQDARRYAALMVPEGPRALAEAHLPLPVVSAAFLRIPALVVGATDDPLINRRIIFWLRIADTCYRLSRWPRASPIRYSTGWTTRVSRREPDLALERGEETYDFDHYGNGVHFRKVGRR
jgi:pimeloyl-ACP methyl ester carboxylesterase